LRAVVLRQGLKSSSKRRQKIAVPE
jgi:hypothetical protein